MYFLQRQGDHARFELIGQFQVIDQILRIDRIFQNDLSVFLYLAAFRNLIFRKQLRISLDGRQRCFYIMCNIRDPFSADSLRIYPQLITAAELRVHFTQSRIDLAEYAAR